MCLVCPQSAVGMHLLQCRQWFTCVSLFMWTQHVHVSTIVNVGLIWVHKWTCTHTDRFQGYLCCNTLPLDCVLQPLPCLSQKSRHTRMWPCMRAHEFVRYDRCGTEDCHSVYNLLTMYSDHNKGSVIHQKDTLTAYVTILSDWTTIPHVQTKIN
jgi:hypothetical protein